MRDRRRVEELAEEDRAAADAGAGGATPEGEAKETGRIEAFSDGLFAIAMTLLVLNIQVPDAPPGRLAAALLRQWPVYLAFLTSFATIGIMWINHHRLYNLIRRSDDVLLVLNLLLLLGVTAVPFTTSLVADYIERPDGQVAAVLYNGLYVVLSVFFNALWLYASRGNRLLGRSFDPRAAKLITRQYATGPLLYLIAVALSLYSVAAGIGMSLLLALYYAIPHRIVHPPPRRPGPAEY
jgi:uncharacterized membrane protein